MLIYIALINLAAFSFMTFLFGTLGKRNLYTAFIVTLLSITFSAAYPMSSGYILFGFILVYLIKFLIK